MGQYTNKHLQISHESRMIGPGIRGSLGESYFYAPSTNSIPAVGKPCGTLIGLWPPTFVAFWGRLSFSCRTLARLYTRASHCAAREVSVLLLLTRSPTPGVEIAPQSSCHEGARETAEAYTAWLTARRYTRCVASGRYNFSRVASNSNSN